MAMYSEAMDLRPRRRWPWVVTGLAIIFVVLWCVAWFYASAKVESTIAGWREREAKVGRLYSCATQTIGGFPFRIDVRCSNPSAEFRSAQPATALKWKDLHVVANVFSPTRLVGELAGPMLIGEPGQLPNMSANWRSAEILVRGLPIAPESVTLTLDDTKVERVAGGGNETVFTAKNAEFTGRMVEGSAASNPVIGFVLKLAGATAPSVHPAAAAPFDADGTAVLRGLKDFGPKTWEERFREIQLAGGRLEITNVRVAQGEIIAVATGQLGLTERGRVDGDLRMTVANFEKLLPALGLDRMMAQATAPGGQFGTAMNSLDRLMPGLGNIARQNAGPAVIAGLGLMGQPTELEGKRAVVLPVKFSDGMVTLGPIPLGPTPALF
jgi:hypothetical protein